MAGIVEPTEAADLAASADPKLTQTCTSSQLQAKRSTANAIGAAFNTYCLRSDGSDDSGEYA